MTQRTLISLVTVITLTSLSHGAEVVKLQNGNSLSGNISASDIPSAIVLKQPFANAPLVIKESAVKELLFQNQDVVSKYEEQVQLINGDRFPCEVSDITPDSISISSSVLGDHIIQRDQISKITFNTKANAPIYKGPGDDLSAWTTSSEDWDLDDGVLTVQGRSDASMQIPKLSKNYILEFSTQSIQAAPYFRFYFSSDSETADRKSSYYYVDFNSHSVTLNRSENGKPDQLANILASDELFTQPKIKVTVQVDRKNQKLAFFINEKLIKIVSELKPAPEGNIIIIRNLQRAAIPTTISDINIYSWSGKVSNTSVKTEEALKKHDLITDLNGNVITGDILNMENSESSELKFSAPFAKSDSAIPKSSIDALQFQHSLKSGDLTEAHFYINLTNGSKMQFIKSQFTKNTLQLDHPILGTISVPHSSIETINAIAKKTPKANETPEKTEAK